MTDIVATDTPTDAVRGGVSPVVLRHLIDGQWREGSGGELLDLNPGRPDDVVARGLFAGLGELDETVTAARAAGRAWATTPFPARGEILQGAAGILAERAHEWGEELSREQGKTLGEGVGEVRRAAETLRFFASEAVRPIGEVFASARAGEQIQTVHKPVGTVAVITPFNFPIAIPAWKIAPALAYGNTVVWKPAPTVPLLAMRLAEALVQAGLPAGVLSLVIGDGPVGQRLVEHPGIDAVTFTGSTAVGRAIIERCGALARPVQTEMGGKNAAAVLTDANLDLAVAQVVSGAFGMAGQRCTATSRVIVSDSVADEFIRRLVEQTSALTVGEQTDPAVRIGPLVSIGARDAVLSAVDEGRARPGVRVLCGGHVYDDERSEGAFLAPTVVELAGSDEDWSDNPFWRDELFGPVVAVRRAADDIAALELVNDTVYGLAAAVFTDDLRAVAAAQELLDVGVLHINSETPGGDPHVPFGGSKESGFGPKEQGRSAREFFTTTMTMYLKPSGRAAG
jgi:acyl-CoA reductase-like NAD-dependent aldehyde dehydrogenase